MTFPPERLCQRVWREPAAARGVPRNVLSAIDRLRRELRPERGEVDWLPVRRRRREADRRIAVMEQYATGRRCRRAALLDYFGERLVRPSEILPKCVVHHGLVSSACLLRPCAKFVKNRIVDKDRYARLTRAEYDL